MAKRAFLDANGVLKSWGFTATNGPSDTVMEVGDEFRLDPEEGWRWDGVGWTKIQRAKAVSLEERVAKLEQDMAVVKSR